MAKKYYYPERGTSGGPCLGPNRGEVAMLVYMTEEVPYKVLMKWVV
jgi:hypothetical protein